MSCQLNGLFCEVINDFRESDALWAQRSCTTSIRNQKLLGPPNLLTGIIMEFYGLAIVAFSYSIESSAGWSICQLLHRSFLGELVFPLFYFM